MDDDKIRILYVDDDEVILNLVAKALRMEGFEIVTCNDARAALRQAIKTEPQLIISDIAMPGMDGYGLLKALQDNPLTSHIPVVFLTAMRESMEKVSAFRSGVVDFITKPFTTSSLVLKVRRLLVGLPLREGTVSGSIEVSPFEEVLDMLQEGLRTGVLKVQAGGEEGIVVLKNGEALDARFGEISGDDAIAAMLGQTTGSFAFREADPSNQMLFSGTTEAEEFETDEPSSAAARRMAEAEARVEDIGAPVPIPNASDDERIETAGKRVLVIDDDAALLNLLATIFEKEGFDTLRARNGLEGLDLAVAERPDVVVTDLMMPHMDGFRLCELIRQDPALATTPVLMLSVKETREEWRRAIQSGADDYLQKTTSLTELVYRVRLLIKRQSENQRRRAPGDRAVMRGEVRHIGIPEVIAILEVNRKTGCMGISRADQRANLYFREGMVIHAECAGDATLAQASERDIVAHVSAWESGNYEFVPDVMPPVAV